MHSLASTQKTHAPLQKLVIMILVIVL